MLTIFDYRFNLAKKHHLDLNIKQSFDPKIPEYNLLQSFSVHNVRLTLSDF